MSSKMFSKHRINVDEYMLSHHKFNLSDTLNTKVSITYDKEIKDSNCDYRIRRQHNHDGTLYFTYGIIDEVLQLVLEGGSYSRAKDSPENKEIDHIQYKIGDMKLMTTWKEIEGKGLRQRERVSLPVVCNIFYKD